jgi:exopolysaccharide biosynthesis protein
MAQAASAATPTPTLPPPATTAVPPARQPATAAPPTGAVQPAAGGADTPNGPDLGDGKFADRFTSGDVEQTATSYRSADVSVTLTQVQRKGVTYYVQDIYIRHIDNLRAAFAKNKYGRSISATTPDIANANGAIGAINGDWYGAGVLGAVIRNGVLYNGRAEGDVGVLYRDGTLRVFGPRKFDAQQAIADGAWQAWDFGPGLLTPEGQAIAEFNSGISGLNPRTAIGYYEPGHYAFVVVDGRQPGYSNGMTLAQLSSLFAEMGCKAAYNLDGGADVSHDVRGAGSQPALPQQPAHQRHRPGGRVSRVSA